MGDLWAHDSGASLGVWFSAGRIHGAKSWIVLGPLSFEPVEIARIGFIVVIAALLDHPEREIRPLKWMAKIFALGGIHMILILRQPYLGGTLVYMPIMLAMLYFAGIPSIYLLAIIFFGGVAVGVPLISTYFSMQPQLLALHPLANFLVASTSGTRSAVELLFMTTSVIFGLWWFIRKLKVRIPWQYPSLLSLIVAMGVYTAHLVQHFIKDYQRKRLVVFLSPGFDPLGAGYHILAVADCRRKRTAVRQGTLFRKPDAVGLFARKAYGLYFFCDRRRDGFFLGIDRHHRLRRLGLAGVCDRDRIAGPFWILDCRRRRMSLCFSMRDEYRHDVGAPPGNGGCSPFRVVRRVAGG